VGKELLQSRLRGDLDDLESRDPMQRLTAVRNVRALIEGLEETAVAQARSAGGRHSWDEIARVMGTTRWSVLRRFGPNGTHPAGDVGVSVAGVPAQRTLPQEPSRQVESLPPELLQKAILLAGELVSTRVREGHPFSDQPVGMRLGVLPRAIRIELSEGQRRSRAPGDDEPPSPVWIELELPREDLPREGPRPADAEM
jgi:hypothetical protein